MKRKLSAGLTSATLPLFIFDTSSSTGAGLSGLLFSTGSLVAEYRRQGSSTWTAITLVTTTLGTWVSGGFIVDGSLAGAYELQLPNAACAVGVRWVAVRLYGATNMLPCLIEMELDAVNYQDSQGFGLTSLPATGTLAVNPALSAAGLDNIVVETGVNARQALSPILSAAAGLVSGAGTGTVVIKAGNVSGTTRITATTDASGNRSAVTLVIPT